MNNQNKKIFVVSLDGATFDVLRPLMAQGYMPNLKSQMERSLSAELESVIPPVTAAAWSSFMTGKHPGKHGILGFTRYDFTDRRDKLNNAQHIRSKTLWQILSSKGKRVVVLQLPFTYPPYQVDGIMVAGWDMPSTDSNFTYPEEIRAEVLRVVPDYATTLDLSLWDRASIRLEAQFRDFTNKLVRAFEQTTQLALHFLEQESEWDVFMVHFQQTDFIQHKLWKYIETACADRDNKEGRIEAVRRCYQRFDEMLGSLLSRVEAINPIRIILSDHGFGDYRGSICPNYYLKEWGYLTPAPESHSSVDRLKGRLRNSTYGAVRRLYQELYRAKSRFLARRELKRYKSWTDLAAQQLSQVHTGIDWEKTTAITLEANQVAFIYVNSTTRSSFGLVQPGPHYEQIVTDIMARLKDIQHPITGERLLADIVRGTDVYPDAVEGVEVPDIVLIPTDGYGFSTAITDAPPQPMTEGLHRSNGILLIGGDGISLNARNFHPRLIDVAPTILHMLGLPVPRDMDGRVLEEVFSAPQNPNFEEADRTPVLPRGGEYNAEEAEIIEQRLKGLGYVE